MDENDSGQNTPLNSRERLVTPEPYDGERPTKFANMALGLDAMFCNIVGLVFTLTGAFMSEWLGVAGWIATLFGVVVLLWSFVVTLFANRRVSRKRELDFVLKANVLTIVVGVVVLAIPDTMSSAGKIMLAIGVAIVAAFSVAQALARKQLR